MASQEVFLLCVFLITQVSVSGFDQSIVNIIVANEESQYVGQFPRTAINITFNISSANNISDSLEQCADAGRPFLFIKNTTILGCGSLLWPENDSIPYTASLNMTLVSSTLNVSPSHILTLLSQGDMPSASLSDGNMFATVHSSGEIMSSTTELVPLKSTLRNGDSSRTIISLPDSSLSDTMQPSKSIVIFSTTTVTTNGTHTNVNYTSVISSADASFPETMQPSTPAVNISTSSIPLNDTQTGGITSSSYRTISQAMQPSHSTVHSPFASAPVTETISPSLAVEVMTTSDVPSGAKTSPNVSQQKKKKILPSDGLGNATNSLATSNGVSSASDSTFSSTISPNGTYSVNTIIQPNSMVHGTVSSINSTKTPSPNGTYSMTVTIQPSSTTAHNVNGVSNTSSAVLHTNWTAKCTNSCQNSAIKNSTELVKAYKTEFFGEVHFTVFTETNYTIRVQNTNNLSVNCSFTPGDRTAGVVAETNASSVSFPHRYFSTGRYRARINCVRYDTVLVKFFRRIIVSLPVVHSELSCPDLFQTDTTYYCVFTVHQASVLDIVVAVGNGSKGTSSFSETSLKVISAENETIHDLKNKTLGLYTPLLVFKHAFYLRCVELLSNTSGAIHLKVGSFILLTDV
mgnify:FL=1